MLVCLSASPTSSSRAHRPTGRPPSVGETRGAPSLQCSPPMSRTRWTRYSKTATPHRHTSPRGHQPSSCPTHSHTIPALTRCLAHRRRELQRVLSSRVVGPSPDLSTSLRARVVVRSAKSLLHGHRVRLDSFIHSGSWRAASHFIRESSLGFVYDPRVCSFRQERC